jgi:hypothetical protein
MPAAAKRLAKQWPIFVIERAIPHKSRDAGSLEARCEGQIHGGVARGVGQA